MMGARDRAGTAANARRASECVLRIDGIRGGAQLPGVRAYPDGLCGRIATR
jgi:hypothetical protein